MTLRYSRDELLICLIANLLKDAGVVAVGSSSPIPAAGALLAQQRYPGKTRALVFRNNVNDPFHESGSELYDRIGQGRIDVFFIGGAQIDGRANLNNIGVGTYPDTAVRFPGSFGTPFIISMVPRVILFREEHSPRVLVDKVDWISAAGKPPEGSYRGGGPTDLVTGKAVFAFDRKQERFALQSVHPGFTAEQIRLATGFDYDEQPVAKITQPPTDEELSLLRGIVADQVAQTYPEFAQTRLRVTL
jgi:glutaconate CoA-transferase subunit B